MKFTKLFITSLLSLTLLVHDVSYATEAAASGATVGEDATMDDVFSVYDEFNLGKAMNYSNCFDYSVVPLPGLCPALIPYPTLILHFTHKDPIALVEVVPDPWKSFLYDESFFDFGDRADTAIVDEMGVTPTVGSGYGNKTQSSSGTDFRGEQKLETHVWAVSDWWRMLKVSGNVFDKCLSLTCKNEDWLGCRKIVTSTMKLASDMKQLVSNMNSNQMVDGKGQGVVNGDQVMYEDGSVYEKDSISGGYKQVKGPGNYGLSDGNGGFIGKAVKFGTSESVIPGVNNAELMSAGAVAGVSLAQGNGFGAAIAAGGVGMSAAGETEWGQDMKQSFNDSMPDFAKSDPPAQNLPSSTTSGGQTQAPRSAPTVAAGSTSSQASKQVSDNALGRNDPSQVAAESEMKNAISGAGSSFGSQGLAMAGSFIDRVVYFNVMEQIIQMIAKMSPIMIHPIYMSERHEDASSDGGLLWSSIFSAAADMGAGLIMPIFCMGQSGVMIADGSMDMVGMDTLSEGGYLDALTSFLSARCVGSWGPLEPRVTYLGTGDHMVAAGLASVRGLNIAQNIAGSMYNKSINNTPYSQLEFNLDWPHQSNCYSFKGFDGLSRGWTSPLVGDATAVVDGLKNGSIAEDIVGGERDFNQMNNQGGYVFTYWKERKCQYWWSCGFWTGDTGL